MEIYTCRKPETLPAIARHLGLAPSALQKQNALPHKGPLPPGFSLLIPGREDSLPRPAELYLCSSQPLPASCRERLSPLFSAMLFPPHNGPDPQPLQAECTALLLLENRGEGGAFDADMAHELLRDAESREAWIQDARQQLYRAGCRGLCLHLQYVRSFDRERLSALLLQLSELLHRDGFYFTVATAPCGDTIANAASTALDLELLGRCCDRVFLQCYDWGHRDSPPQAPAPLPRLQESLEAALHHIPAGHLVLGLCSHGYRWKLPWRQGQQAEAISHGRARDLSLACSREILWDRFAQSPFFLFSDPDGQRYGVWYEDVRSLRRKLLLVYDYGLAGAAFFGSEPWDAGSLALLQSLFCRERLP